MAPSGKFRIDIKILAKVKQTGNCLALGGDLLTGKMFALLILYGCFEFSFVGPLLCLPQHNSYLLQHFCLDCPLTLFKDIGPLMNNELSVVQTLPNSFWYL